MKKQPPYTTKEEKEKSSKRFVFWIFISFVLSLIFGVSAYVLRPASPSSSASSTSTPTSSTTSTTTSIASSETSSTSTVTSSSETPTSSEIISSVTSSELTVDFRLQLLEPLDALVIRYATHVDGIDYFITDDDSGPLLLSAFNGDSLLFKEFLDANLMLNNVQSSVAVPDGFLFSTVQFVNDTLTFATHYVTSAGIIDTQDSIYLLENKTTHFPGIYAIEVFSEGQELVTIDPDTGIISTVKALDNLDPYMAIMDDISVFYDTYSTSSSAFYFLQRFNLLDQGMYVDLFNSSTHQLLDSLSGFELAGGTFYVANESLFISEGPSVTRWAADGSQTVANPSFLTVLPSANTVLLQIFPNTYKVYVNGEFDQDITGTNLNILGESDTAAHVVIYDEDFVSIYTFTQTDITLVDTVTNSLTLAFREDWSYPTQLTSYDDDDSVLDIFTVIEGNLYNIALPNGDSEETFEAFSIVDNDASSINLDHDVTTDTLTVEVYNADDGAYTIPITATTITDVDMIGVQDEFLLLSISQDGGTTYTALLVNLIERTFYVMNNDLRMLMPGLNQNRSLQIIVNRSVNAMYVFNDYGYILISFTGGTNFPALTSDTNFFNYILIDREGADDYVLQFYRSASNVDLVTVYVIYGDLSLGLAGMANKGGYVIDATTISFSNLSFFFDASVADFAYLLYRGGYYSTLISMDETDNEVSVYHQDGNLIGLDLVTLEETPTPLNSNAFIPFDFF